MFCVLVFCQQQSTLLIVDLRKCGLSRDALVGDLPDPFLVVIAEQQLQQQQQQQERLLGGVGGGVGGRGEEGESATDKKKNSAKKTTKKTKRGGKKERDGGVKPSGGMVQWLTNYGKLGLLFYLIKIQ